jgi:hypothetical protein
MPGAGPIRATSSRPSPLKSPTATLDIGPQVTSFSFKGLPGAEVKRRAKALEAPSPQTAMTIRPTIARRNDFMKPPGVVEQLPAAYLSVSVGLSLSIRA